MPGVQGHLPERLCAAASELPQEAVQRELRRRRPMAATDRYLADLIGEAGKPTVEELAGAEAVLRGIQGRVRTGHLISRCWASTREG